MNISSDLISQLVKVTDDTPEVKNETTVYGTVKEYNGSLYVQMDGSDLLTPVSDKSTFALENGERVIIMIKNHQAIVTGNLTSPAARWVTDGEGNKSVEGLDIGGILDELAVQKLTVKEIVADNVTINEKLTANTADITNLSADYGSFKELTTNDLSATNAKIDNLAAEHGEFETLTAQNFEAVNAKIAKLDVGTLDADVASIKTLIFGSASGDTIQTSFSNSVIAQLGDAQIKSAMIESISASKITAGDIITNNVRVKSEDGSLIISDETMQISDGTRVRVQIGKDASNDYSINIWDASGNLMFSKGGITDSAIKEAIIRNDMVSDTANISAHKLDIDSLFEEINDSSNTIKSTKVYLDDKKQTLDVAFKSLETTVTGQGETITSQGTAISAIQGQITSKVWQQDIDTATNTMSTQYSTLEQSLSSFETTVSSTYATKTALAETDATANSAYSRTVRKSGTIDLTSDDYDVNTYYPISGGAIPQEGYRYIGVNVHLNSGSVPPWSTHDKGFTCNLSARMKNCGWGTVNYETLGWIDDFSYNFCDAMPAYINQNRNAGKPVLYLRGGGKYFIFTDYNTSWTAYASDYTESNITFSPTTNPTNYPSLVSNWNVVSRVSTAESSIEQLADRITANVTEITDLGTRMSTVEQTADGLSVKLDSLEVGGRNYILSSATMVPGNASAGITLTSQDDGGVKIVTTSGNGNWHSWYQPSVANANLSDGDEFTFSVDIKCDEGSTGKPTIYIKSGMGYYVMKGSVSTKYTRLYYTGTWNSTNNVQFHFGWNNTVGTFYVRRPKLEKGNRYTDWTPAPEDIDDGIANASKTATNYLNFSSAGLVIGDMTSATLGKNILIDSDSVDIRSGTAVRASFGEDYLYLAKHSRNAKIDLCNGLATLYHQSKYSYDTLFVIDTPNATEIMGTYNPLYVTSTVTGKVAIQFSNKDGTLGSIGMVASGTGAYITRNVPSTASTYSVLDTGNFYSIMDSGWLYCAINTSGKFTIYDDGSNIRYRKIGKMVEVVGAVKPKEALAAGTTNYVFGTLPSGYRPSLAITERCQGSSGYSWLFSITTAGELRYSRYSNGSSCIDLPASTWLPFHATFFTD